MIGKVIKDTDHTTKPVSGKPLVLLDENCPIVGSAPEKIP
jgi:hypothetical protein